MIYPTLNKVGNGQRLSVELVNGLIKRTEYAAYLLRQYKLIAGNDITLNSVANGTTISASANANAIKYRGYIMPTVPSENDILLEEDVPIIIESPTELGGLLAQDLPLDQRQKIVYPDYVLAGGYELVVSGAYWANFDIGPNLDGLYPSITGANSPITLGGINGFPSFGPHPNAPRDGQAGGDPINFFFGGSLTLRKIQ